MSYAVIIENKAQKEFKRIARPFDKSIKKAIDSLIKNPRPQGVKKLSGTSDGYRIRVGDYRILYTINERNRLVTIYRIRHRKNVYEH